MITKAYIEEVISPYQMKVRMPIFDKPSGVNLCTNNENLSIATICCLPNIIPQYNVGDVVFVAFEDNNLSTPVILGVLYAENINTNTYCNINGDSIDDILTSTY